jgi:hypothetical protein
MRRLSSSLARSRALNAEAGRNTKLITDVALSVGLLLLGGWFYGTRWLDLFPLNEFRNWISWRAMSLDDLLRQVALVRGRYAPFASRGVSLFVVTRTADVCGLHAQCLNAPQIGVVLASVVLLYALIVRLLHRRLLAFLVAVMWLFSLGVVDSIAWQATINDKLAVFFTLIGLHVALSFFERRNGKLGLVIANGVLLIVVVLAYNSKESAWVLVPSLILLAITRLERFDWRSVGRQLALLALPASYVLYHYLRYRGSLATDPRWSLYVHDGNPWTNLQTLVQSLANGDSTSTNGTLVIVTSIVLLAALALIGFVAAKRLWRTRTDSTARVALWAEASAVIALVLPIQSQEHNRYYILVPSVFIYIALAAGATMLITARPPLWAARASGFAPVLLVSLLAFNFATSYSHDYASYPRQSANLVDSFPHIRAALPRTLAPHVYLVSNAAPLNTSRFLARAYTTRRHLYEYIFGTSTPAGNLESHFIDMTPSALDTTPREPNSYYVIFDHSLRLTEIDLGNHPVYRRLDTD